jgi:hypothetical protein
MISSRIHRIRRSTYVLAMCLIILSATLVSNLAAPQAQAACSALPTDKGTVTSTVDIASAGTYRVWSRIMAPDTTNNAFLMQVDQTYCAISVGGGTAIPASAWTWVDYQNGSQTTKINMTLTAGTHTVVLAGSAAGVMVDRVIFTTDTTCVPSGTGDNCATPPATVNLSNVSDGQTLTGGVGVGATVSNATGVTKVEFYVDNVLFSTDTTSPYCMGGDNGTTCNNVDTAQFTNGAHALKATVTYAGGTLNATVNVTIQNTTPTVKIGDLNHDGSVNIFDLSIILSKWATTDANSDLNHDGTVNIFDLSILLSHWGT